MSDFKGFDDWIAIFKGGKQTDSGGNEHDGDSLITKAVETFNLQEHEPPICVGHPNDNAPAFGWVRDLKQKENILYAKMMAVVPEFEEAVKQGLYKKRSASFYPDGRLRHVGFLGAVPPAVKGLAGIKFEDQDAISFDFYDPALNTVAVLFRNIRDWFIDTQGKQIADNVIPDWDVNRVKELANEPENDKADIVSAFSQPNIKKEVQKMNKIMLNMLSSLGFKTDRIPKDALPDESGIVGNFAETDIQAAVDKAVNLERESVKADFAEKELTAKKESRLARIPVWCEQMAKEGKLTPSMIKGGIPEVLSFLAANDDVIEFGEEKTKATAFDQMVDLFENQLPKIVNFGEIATKKTDMGGKSAEGQIEELIKAKLTADVSKSYGVAFTEVQAENPAIIQEYAAGIK